MTTRLEQLDQVAAHGPSVDGGSVDPSGRIHRDRLLRLLQGEVIAWKAHNLVRLLTEAAQGVDFRREETHDRQIWRHHARVSRLSSPLAVDALGASGLPFESAGEDAEDDDATTWNIDYMYDVGLMIGGGSNNIQKNIIGERGLDLPREPKVKSAVAIGRA